MMQRLKDAAEDGLVIGIKIFAVLLVITLGMGWFMNDYAHVRTIALTVEKMLQQQQAQAQQQQARPQPVAPTPAK